MNTTSYPAYWPQFYTATINKWKHLLSSHECKDIIIDSLKFFSPALLFQMPPSCLRQTGTIQPLVGDTGGGEELSGEHQQWLKDKKNQ